MTSGRSAAALNEGASKSRKRAAKQSVEQGSPKIYPFYERITRKSLLGRIIVSIFLGALSLLFQVRAIGYRAFGIGGDDWSWFLALLISTEMLCLYCATYALRKMAHELDTRLSEDAQQAFRSRLKKVFSDRKFFGAGLLFGALNCGFGFLFGLPYNERFSIATILFGYFLAGFIGGMAILGIYGVFVSIRSAFFLETEKPFDYTSPDRCGGMLFLGNALIVFGSVTLIAGVMISVYIWHTHWSGDNTWWVVVAKAVWLGFPYVASLIACIAPAIVLNERLSSFKSDEQHNAQKNLREISQRLTTEADPNERKRLHEEYAIQQNKRKELHDMRTWPFGLGANLAYLSVIASNAFLTKTILPAALLEIQKLLGIGADQIAPHLHT